jgi:hypothetical protein
MTAPKVLVARQARLMGNCHPNKDIDACYFYRARCAGQLRSQFLIIAHTSFFPLGAQKTWITYSASLAGTSVVAGAALGTGTSASSSAAATHGGYCGVKEVVEDCMVVRLIAQSLMNRKSCTRIEMCGVRGPYIGKGRGDAEVGPSAS